MIPLPDLKKYTTYLQPVLESVSLLHCSLTDYVFLGHAQVVISQQNLHYTPMVA